LKKQYGCGLIENGGLYRLFVKGNCHQNSLFGQRIVDFAPFIHFWINTR